MYSKTIDFGKVDYKGSGQKNCRVTVEVRLRDQLGTVVLSICGNVWNPRETDIYRGGQCLDTLTELVPTEKMRRIHEVWSEWHLNGMSAGTPAQTAIVKAAQRGCQVLFYTQACAALEAVGLLYDPSEDRDNGEGEPRGYRYGSEWLHRELPTEIVEEVKTW